MKLFLSMIIFLVLIEFMHCLVVLFGSIFYSISLDHFSKTRYFKSIPKDVCRVVFLLRMERLSISALRGGELEETVLAFK